MIRSQTGLAAVGLKEFPPESWNQPLDWPLTPKMVSHQIRQTE